MREREILTRLRKLDLVIKERRVKNRINYYNKERVHYKQVEFHRMPHRIRWVFGGNRSGKTECGAAEVVYLARGIHPYRECARAMDGWVVSVSRDVQREVAQRKILSYLNPDWIKNIVMVSGSKTSAASGVIDFIEVESIKGGVSRIGFKSCDQGREKFQGASLDYVWFDEEPPEDVFDECYMRVIDRKGLIFGTMTPLKGLTFVYHKIYMRQGVDRDIWCAQMEWADNPYLDRAEIDRLTETLSKEELEKRRYGRFYSGTGLVYSEFDENVHVIEPFDIPCEWQDNISIDPGLYNPLSAHWYAVDGDGTIFVAAEYYRAGLTVEQHSEAIRGICEALGWKRDGKGRINALIDSAASAKTLAAAKSVAELFFDNGIVVNTKVNKDVFSGINRVKSLLMARPPRIYIFKTCVHMIKEFKSYWWGEGDNPKKKDDHAMDELRYYVMSRPEPSKMNVPKSIIEIDKEKRIRQIRLNR